MQDKSRFGLLHTVCFNEENYPYDIFQNLRPFQQHIRTTFISDLPLESSPNDFLEFKNISEEVKLHFERNISPIQSINFNGINTAFFNNVNIGSWYLKEINENSIIGYHNSIPNSGTWIWRESRYDLKYKESEIVYCIRQRLSKFYKQNNRFEIEFNKYKSFFSGTLAEFLECLINEYEDFYYSTHLGFNYYYMNKIEGYDGLKDKLIEMVNNLPTPDQVQEATNNVKSDINESTNPFDKIEITNPNYGKGFIERDGKYYLQLKDGEVGHSLEEIKKLSSAIQNMQERHNTAITRYSKILELPINNMPKSFDSIIEIDWFIDVLIKFYGEKKETIGTEIIVTQIQMFIDIQNEFIFNPLLIESRENNIYFKTRLESLLNIWNKYTKTKTPDQAEESKTVQQPPIIKDEVNGNPCIEFDNLFGADIARKNEVWRYMKLLGMIDNEGNYLLKTERAIIRAFVMVMKKNGRFAPTAEEGFLIRVLGLKLLADNKVRVRKTKQIEDKQKEIVTFLNNQETKNNSFVNVD